MKEQVFKTFFVEAATWDNYERLLESKIQAFKQQNKKLREINRSAPAISSGTYNDGKMIKTYVIVGVSVTFTKAD